MDNKRSACPSVSHRAHHAQTNAVYNVTGLIPSNTNFLMEQKKKKNMIVMFYLLLLDKQCAHCRNDHET